MALKRKTLVILLAAAALFAAALLLFVRPNNRNEDFVTYRVSPQKAAITLFWKDGKGVRFQSLAAVQREVEAKGRRLLFAMNGGMFRPDYSPLGLYIEAGKTVVPLDTASGTGNFYQKPNGVFYLTSDNKAGISTTGQFRDSGTIRYATQSGPMLLVEGKMHPAFRPRSRNRTIRNGVGILPTGEVLFVLSKTEINFYDFADYFRRQGCRQALYLDGFVSRAYLPQTHQAATDGNFGVIIGVMQGRPANDNQE